MSVDAEEHGVTGPQDPVDREDHPRGTIAILVLFVASLALLWTLVYVIMLVRGTAG